jgi:hypothetical protein
MNTFIIKSFEIIASEMERTNVNPEAIITYDLFADALAWSDEYPNNYLNNPNAHFDEMSSIRVLFRYRTTILLGTPDEILRPYWDQALLLFPNWAGFNPERLKPKQELVNFYECNKTAGNKNIIRLEKYFCRLCNKEEMKNDNSHHK